jgi:integrase
MPRLHENMRIAEAVRRFLARMEREGQAAASVTSAAYTMQRFAERICNTRDPDPFVHLVTPASVDQACFGPGGLRDGRRGKPISGVYFNRHRTILNSFFEYCVLMEWTDGNPARGVSRAREDARTSPLMLNNIELQALMDHTANPVERIACSLGMNTGMRGFDIKHLTVFDVNMPSGELQTEIRKTRDLDIKPITMELNEELERWLAAYAQATGLAGPDDLPNNWLLVPSYTYTPINGGVFKIRPTRTITHPHRLVQRPLERMGYPIARTGFHTLRRSSARVLFELLREDGHGRDHALLLVKAFLNHASTAQTEVYLGLTPERVLRAQILKSRSFLGRPQAAPTMINTVSSEQSNPLTRASGE